MNKRLFLLIVLVAAGVLSSRLLPPSYDKPRSVTLGEADLPPLKALKYVPEKGLDIDLKRGAILVAVELIEGTNPDDLAADFIDIYRWGRTYFSPLKCGPDYPADMCKIGVVYILVVSLEETLNREGANQGYFPVLDISLDQVQIDRMMENPPGTIDELASFHQQVVEQTQGTGGSIKVYDPPEIFNGFK